MLNSEQINRAKNLLAEDRKFGIVRIQIVRVGLVRYAVKGHQYGCSGDPRQELPEALAQMVLSQQVQERDNEPYPSKVEEGSAEINVASKRLIMILRYPAPMYFIDLADYYLLDIFTTSATSIITLVYHQPYCPFFAIITTVVITTRSRYSPEKLRP